jgi:hypothetical protein
MNLEEVTRLCERLSESVSLGPGVQNALFALPEARSTIAALRGEISAREVRKQLVQVERAFDKWFTERDWRGHDQGESFQRDLYANINKLKVGIQLWYSSRSASSR